MQAHKRTAEWILRIGIFGTFLGHGIYALGVKQEWIPLITTFGFSDSAAADIMPVIGAVDIVVAFAALVYPIRLVLIHATLWAFATALSRPLAGQSVLDFVERASNWAAPLALLLLQGIPKKFKDIFTVR